jgi:hypothetical protein
MSNPSSPATPPQLLNDDGSASMATAILMSHHGLRRDLACFAAALRAAGGRAAGRAAALAAEWRNYRATLHGHHEAEDNGLFPATKAQQPELGAVIERLTADHRRIDPLLEQGDAAFAELAARWEEAASVVSQLSTLLDEHLALEEARVIPSLRGARSFPPPATDAEAAMYADGFAWASYGIAPDVLERVNTMLPAVLTAKLPAARAAFEQRWLRAWGRPRAGASRSAVPDWLLTDGRSNRAG